jgi:predicted kinase
MRLKEICKQRPGTGVGFVLYIFGGLPGTGKSTLSSALSQQIRATYLRVDVVEQAMRDAGVWIDGPAGYMVCYGVASQNLRLGLEVVVDTVNPIHETRLAWRNVAKSLDAPFVEIEVVCSDEYEHHQRITSRDTDIAGLTLPTWDDVTKRRYEPWDRDHIVIDTARKSIAESLAALHEELERIQTKSQGDMNV